MHSLGWFATGAGVGVMFVHFSMAPIGFDFFFWGGIILFVIGVIILIPARED